MVTNPARRRVFVHVGVPKSGTSFLQAGMRENSKTLRELGVLFPAQYPAEMYHATLEIRGIEEQWGHRAGEFDGTWARLCRRARAFDGTSVISHELLSSATPEQVRTALAELEGTEVHIVVTARDLARQIPAAWQQGLKHGGKVTFAEFVERTFDPARSTARAQQFWDRQDVPDVLARWGAGLPPERVHVVTNPPSGSAPHVLWDRFLSVFGVDPSRLTLPGSGSNVSLGITEIDLLRRVNAVVPRADQPRVYSRIVNGHLVNTLRHHSSPRASTPVALYPLLQDMGKRWVTEIEARGYDVVGDLSELVSADPSPSDVDPDAVSPEETLDLAVSTIGILLKEVDELKRRRPTARLGGNVEQPGLARRVAGRVKRSLRRPGGPSRKGR